MVVLEETIVPKAGDAEKDPRFHRPDPQWDGTGDAMDSERFPDKGYRSAKP